MLRIHVLPLPLPWVSATGGTECGAPWVKENLQRTHRLTHRQLTLPWANLTPFLPTIDSARNWTMKGGLTLGFVWKTIRQQDAKEVAVGNRAEETYLPPDFKWEESSMTQQLPSGLVALLLLFRMARFELQGIILASKQPSGPTRAGAREISSRGEHREIILIGIDAKPNLPEVVQPAAGVVAAQRQNPFRARFSSRHSGSSLLPHVPPAARLGGKAWFNERPCPGVRTSSSDRLPLFLLIRRRLCISSRTRQGRRAVRRVRCER